MKERNYFLEISYMRPILIILLVFYHSFIIYNGGWSQPQGFEPCEIYKWLDRLAYSFMLPSFVFMSGYIWGGQIQVKKKKDSFIETVKKKAKRLLIPSIIFSILYLFLFQDRPNSFLDGVLMILNGAGHMWFLPMLFWCFLMGYILMSLKLPLRFEVIIVIALGLLNFLPIPFRFGEALGYLQYFYIGYLVCPHSDNIKNRVNNRTILLLWGIFLILFLTIEPLSDLIREDLSSADISIIHKAFHYAALEFSRSILSWGGLIAFYFTSLNYVNSSKRSEKQTEIVLSIGNLCFGVYLFQQFIIQYLYYKTPMPQLLGLWLPWISFIFTLLISLLLTYLVKHSKVCRQFI